MTAPLAPHGIPGHLVDFVEALRGRGIPVGPSETIDAGAALAVLPLIDRDAVREGLACSLIRRPGHRPVFDAMFDLWWPAAIGARAIDEIDEIDEDHAQLPLNADGEIDFEELRNRLADMLADGSAAATAMSDRLAATLVEKLGAYQSRNGTSYSAYQALKQLPPQTLLEKILSALLLGDPSATEAEIATRVAQQRIADFRATVERETRRRTAETNGRERMVEHSVPKLAENVNFLQASRMELVALQRTVAPLARLLAARLAARRRRAHAGQIDLRRTLRKSMSTGGVPIDVVQRKPRRVRPELVVLCDVSGSVAGFSQFTLLLVSALRSQFSRVRVFAFIDTADEVSDYFAASADLASAMSRMLGEAELVRFDGHSDYGNAFVTFREKYPDVLTPRCSLLVLGDGRTNYRKSHARTLGEMADAARHAYWLNPEPISNWGTGDSMADEYRRHIDMRECRTAAQLADVIENLLPA